MNLDEYFEWWMRTIYPNKGYVNALSTKWCKEFANDWNNYSFACERAKNTTVEKHKEVTLKELQTAVDEARSIIMRLENKYELD